MSEVAEKIRALQDSLRKELVAKVPLKQRLSLNLEAFEPLEKASELVKNNFERFAENISQWEGGK